jgi:polysaccharide pyruvyl transferase WcaK-like protein
MKKLKENATHHRPPHILLVGYNGANNTGSEARLLAIIEDVREVFGPEAFITIPTLNEANLRRYVKEEPRLHIVAVPSIYFLATWQLVKSNDIVMLVEGSCYMDTWTSALLWFFLWATRCAHAYDKPCLAYAVDTGHLSLLNKIHVRREASKTNLIITRTQAAAERLRSWGVTAPIEVTADNAFYFRINPIDEDLLPRIWPEASSGVVGMALVDFYCWPVIIRPWGRPKDCYRWPYYFPRSKTRERATKELIKGFAAEADRIIEEYNQYIALIAMEELDLPIIRKVRKHMVHPDRVRVFSSKQYNASQMTAILRSLDFLVSSRYHACVLSMAAGIPMIAVGHDFRLKNLFHDLGIYDELFISHQCAELFPLVRERIDYLLAYSEPTHEVISNGYKHHVTRAKQNRELLKNFAKNYGWSVMQ